MTIFQDGKQLAAKAICPALIRYYRVIFSGSSERSTAIVILNGLRCKCCELNFVAGTYIEE